MSEFFLIVVAVILAAIAYSQRQKASDNERSLKKLGYEQKQLESQVASLTARLYRLETAQPAKAQAAVPTVATPIQPVQTPLQTAPVANVADAATEAQTVPPSVQQPRILVPPTVEQVEASSRSGFPSTPSLPGYIPAPPPPSLPKSFRPPEKPFSLEEAVGGNLFAKLGALLMVIGAALGLGLWVPTLGPVGKACIGFLGGLTLLLSGIFVERRFSSLMIPARALVATGWGTLYFTAYAIHGLEEARIIDSPFVGLTILVAVAVAMVWFGLRYGSQAVTLVTFAAVFIGLAIYPATMFSYLATLPLVAFLLIVVVKRDWPESALGGILMAYGCLVAQWYPEKQHSLIALAVFVGFYVLFEAFDLWSIQKRGRLLHPALFGLNAMGFLIVGLLPDGIVGETRMTPFLFAAAVMMTLGGFGRAKLPKQSGELSFLEGTPLPITIGSFLFAGGLVRQFLEYQPATAGLLLFAMSMALLWAGWFSKRKYFEWLGIFWLVPTLAALFGGHPSFRQLTANPVWITAATICVATIFFSRWKIGNTLLSWFALPLLLGIATAAADYSAILLLAAAVLSLALAFIARQKLLAEASWQSIALSLASLLVALVWMADVGAKSWAAWPYLAAAIGAGFASWICSQVVEEDSFWTSGRSIRLGLGASIFLAFAQLSIWNMLPSLWIIVGLVALFGLWVEVYIRRTKAEPDSRRWPVALQCGVLLLISLGRLLSTHFDHATGWNALTVNGWLAVIGIFAVYAGTKRVDFPIRQIIAYATALVSVAGVYAVAEQSKFTLGLGIFGACLLAGGLMVRERPIRISGLAALTLAIFKLLVVDLFLSSDDTLTKVITFVALGALLIAGSFAYAKLKHRIQELL
jgi:hypothetical protein